MLNEPFLRSIMKQNESNINDHKADRRRQSLELQ